MFRPNFPVCLSFWRMKDAAADCPSQSTTGDLGFGSSRNWFVNNNIDPGIYPHLQKVRTFSVFYIDGISFSYWHVYVLNIFIIVSTIFWAFSCCTQCTCESSFSSSAREIRVIIWGLCACCTHYAVPLIWKTVLNSETQDVSIIKFTKLKMLQKKSCLLIVSSVWLTVLTTFCFCSQFVTKLHY